MFTKGEWSINSWTQPDSEIRIGAEGTSRIATVNLRDVSVNQQKANAQLISASPNLFKACKMLKEIFPENELSELDASDFKDRAAMIFSAVREAKVAINKAEDI